MSTGQFQYRCLEHADSFRLLFLEPSTDRDAELIGSLHHAKLSDCDYDLVESYTALSYVWGDATLKETIHIGGCVKEITASLDAALRDMRDKNRVHRIWADALCIDQSNTSEKNQQVALMGRIYSTAHHTVIHLGKSLPAFDELATALRTQSVTQRQSKTLDLGQLTLPSEIDDMREALLARPWFRRVWVFQELVLSTDAWVQCGSSRIRWHQFCAIVGTDRVVDAMLLKSLSDSAPSLTMATTPGPLENMNSKRYGAFEVSLSKLLASRRGIGATDPRDIIFGHLGVVSDRERCEKFIKVDYGRDLAQVSHDAAQYFLDATNIETLLNQAMNFSPGDTSPIPSWCPRWGSPQLSWAGIHRGTGARFGGGDDIAYISFKGIHHVLSTEEPVLSISGFRVTGVKVTSCIFHVGENELGGQDDGRDLAIKILQDISSLDLEGFVPLPSDMPDITNNLGPAQQAFRELFTAWAHAAHSHIYQTVSQSNVEGIFNALLHHVMKPETSPLSERKLAFTKNHDCALVPSGTEAGDIITMLADCNRYAVLRPLEGQGFEDLNSSITSEFERLNLPECTKGIVAQVISVDDEDYDEFELRWEEAEEPFAIQHASLVGQCFIDEGVPWKGWLPRSASKVFCLH